MTSKPLIELQLAQRAALKVAQDQYRELVQELALDSFNYHKTNSIQETSKILTEEYGHDEGEDIFENLVAFCIGADEGYSDTNYYADLKVINLRYKLDNQDSNHDCSDEAYGLSEIMMEHSGGYRDKEWEAAKYLMRELYQDWSFEEMWIDVS